MRQPQADLMVMAYVIIFVPQAARDHSDPSAPSAFTPRCCRCTAAQARSTGRSSWGATKTGLTIFWPSDGLDEGDILLQKEVRHRPRRHPGRRSTSRRSFRSASRPCAEAIDLVREARRRASWQDDSQATYESWCRKADAQIDWSKPAEQVYNLIRGTNPQPGAWTTFKGAEVQIYDSRRADGSGAPGEVVAVSGDGVLVQAEGGRVLVQRVRPKGGDKQGAAEWANAAGIAAGSRLGT
jgi:methionyl-tRNA formyltransferase